MTTKYQQVDNKVGLLKRENVKVVSSHPNGKRYAKKSHIRRDDNDEKVIFWNFRNSIIFLCKNLEFF